MQFAKLLDGIPVVSSTTDRGILFPTPLVNQRVFNLQTGTIERWDGTQWVADIEATQGIIPKNGRTVSSLAAYTANNAVINVKDFAPTGYVAGTTDALSMINAAFAAAELLNVHHVLCPPEDYLCDSARVVVPQGITLYAVPSQGEYDGNPYYHGARFIRSNAGVANQPIVQLSTSSACTGIELRWSKTGGALQGILRLGESGQFVTYARFHGPIRGTRTGDITGSTTCYGVFFPNTADAKYFNEIDGIVTECDVSLRMGQLANANRINLTTRESHLHCDLYAVAGQCIENDITLRMFAISVLSPAWGLRMHNTGRNKIRGVYEAYGSCFYADDGTTSSDQIDIVVNEASPSYAPLNAQDFRYSPIVNRSQVRQMTLPVRTTGDRDIFGRGNKVEFFKTITGTLPNVNRPAGTLAAGDANCKKIIQFGSQFAKAALNTLRCRLRVYAYTPFNHGMTVVDVEFLYRNTSTAGPGALNVLSVKQKGADITGLYFLTGVAASSSFAIAVVGGGTGSNTPFDAMAVSLEVETVAYSTNVVDMSTLASVTFATADITANDVTDGISLLTVADTVV